MSNKSQQECAAAWIAVFEKILELDPEVINRTPKLTGEEIALKWISEHAVNPMETATFLVNTNKELQEERDSLKKALSKYQNEVVDKLEDRIKDQQRIVGIKDAALDNLRSERDRLSRVIELKEERIERLAGELGKVKEERTKIREELGTLLTRIDEWKINSGLY